MKISVPLTSLFLGTALMAGCGGSSGNGKGGGEQSGGGVKGHLIDSPIAGVKYICGDGTTGKTTMTGEFSCKIPPVTFNIGNLVLGKINGFTADNKVYPQDLVGVPRDNFNDAKLIKLIRLLQSLDADGVIETEIIVPPEVDTAFQDATDAMTLEELALLAGVTLVSEADAINHLKNSLGVSVKDSSLDGKKLWVTGCYYTKHTNPEDDSYTTNISSISFKNGKVKIGETAYIFRYNYTVDSLLELFTRDGAGIAFYTTIGNNYYQDVDSQVINDSFETNGFWSTKAKAQSYIGAVTSKNQRSCVIVPGPDML